MPADDHSADVVLCASSLHFLGAVAFADWLRVLRPGGRLAFSVVSGARFRPSGPFAAFVPEDLAFPLDEAGAAALAGRVRGRLGADVHRRRRRPGPERLRGARDGPVNLERFADGHLTRVNADGSRVTLRLEAYTEYRLVPGEVSVVEVFALRADPAELAMAGPPAADHCAGGAVVLGRRRAVAPSSSSRRSGSA